MGAGYLSGSLGKGPHRDASRDEGQGRQSDGEILDDSNNEGAGAETDSDQGEHGASGNNNYNPRDLREVSLDIQDKDRLDEPPPDQTSD